MKSFRTTASCHLTAHPPAGRTPQVYRVNVRLSDVFSVLFSPIPLLLSLFVLQFSVESRYSTGNDSLSLPYQTSISLQRKAIRCVKRIDEVNQHSQSTKTKTNTTFPQSPYVPVSFLTTLTHLLFFILFYLLICLFYFTIFISLFFFVE